MSGHKVATLNDRCTNCGECAAVCPSKALEMAGVRMTLGEVMEVIEKERIFMEESGGGVTFSGGEPLMQWPFLEALLEECGWRNIHRAVDTAGHVGQDILKRIAGHTDLFLYDLKLMDDMRHKEWTGVSNRRILENLRFLSGSGARIFIRLPLISGVNDDEHNLHQTASFIKSLPELPEAIYLLPYHPVARHKFAKLEREDDFVLFEEPTMESVETAVKILCATGVPVHSGK
jgi:pyruvate formate lyase activating enzyme